MSFTDCVMATIRQIPKGKVSTYGTIAGVCGSPRAALMVGQILAKSSVSANLPWQRVINSKGLISIINMQFPTELQAKMLELEGVHVNQRGQVYWVDLKKYGYFPNSSGSRSSNQVQ